MATNDSLYVYTGTGNDISGNWTVGVDAAKDHEATVAYTYYGFGDKPERSNMRALYRIIVVNPKTEAISGPYFVVAKDESGALLKADLPQNVRANSEDYDILIECVGGVRAKKDVQKVKVVKEDDE